MVKVLLRNAQSETFHHTYIGYVVSALGNCVALKATPPQGTTLYSLVAAPTCTWKLDINFDDMAFAHMLKSYSLFPGLVMQFRSGLFRCCSLTGSCVLRV